MIPTLEEIQRAATHMQTSCDVLGQQARLIKVPADRIQVDTLIAMASMINVQTLLLGQLVAMTEARFKPLLQALNGETTETVEPENEAPKSVIELPRKRSDD